MSKTISAREAAALLGVSPATLYSYVSRGLLVSSSDGGARARRYAQDDVLRLAARRGDGKRAGHAVAAALSWGVPMLETRIAHVDSGRLYYRGHDACALAEHATLEQAARLLWQPWLADTARRRDRVAATADSGPGAAPAAANGVAPGAASGATDGVTLQAAAAGLPPLPRAMALLPLAAARLVTDHPMDLLRLTASLLLGQEPAPCGGDGSGDDDSNDDAPPLHRQAAAAWGVDARGAQVLRAAMVVLADHELNNSAFTVRCVASSGAALPLVLCAGLAALSGPEHGGHYRVAKTLLQREAAEAGTAQAAPMTPGFGHPLYPDGDVRAAYLMEKLHAADAAACAPYTALAARAAAIPGAQPNSDFALAALELVLGLPDGAALALLAMARTAGWIAHALEQRGDGRMIRPRARYVGDFNAVS